MKNKVDKLGIGKLEPTPVDLSNVVKNEIIKKNKILMILKKLMILKRKIPNTIIKITLLLKNLIR